MYFSKIDFFSKIGDPAYMDSGSQNISRGINFRTTMAKTHDISHSTRNLMLIPNLMSKIYVCLRIQEKIAFFKICVDLSKKFNVHWISIKISIRNMCICWLRNYFQKTGGDSGDIPETFSRFCNFGACLRGFSGNYFQVSFMATYPWKNIFSTNGSWLRGMTTRIFRSSQLWTQISLSDKLGGFPWYHV